ncbi:hypothetical protein B9Y56_20220 [Stenotrophomonas maltophilia]|nr:hypothetical protein B9Y56_20220 [Stenotrophomonas maltophilia]
MPSTTDSMLSVASAISIRQIGFFTSGGWAWAIELILLFHVVIAVLATCFWQLLSTLQIHFEAEDKKPPPASIGSA